MKELRPGSSGTSKLRILFAFDPLKRGIFLVAGDKAGQWKSWYENNIRIADDLYDEHLKTVEAQKARERESQRALRASTSKNKTKKRR